MKRLLILVMVIALAMLAVAPLSYSTYAALRASPGLQFVPLVKVAPDNFTSVGSTTAACTTPAPQVTFVFFHCYTPSDIYTAYGVDTLHNEGLTGAGETIVILDSYGSPTVQQDLDTFSDTFGLPRTTIQIIHPDGKPPFNNSVNGSQTG